MDRKVGKDVGWDHMADGYKDLLLSRWSRRRVPAKFLTASHN